jgi:putative OPT family oligopeptide transporter
MTTKKPSAPEPKSVAEVTLRAVVLGVLVGLVMAVANVYLGLFAGMTVSASIPAAVISMGLLRGVFRNGSILENNIVQTTASAGESLAAGIIFTMPALVIAGVWTDFDFTVTTAVGITGGMLGVLFMIPLRKPLIVDDEDLIYPEGVACAQVLAAGQQGGAGMRSVFAALGVGAAIKLLADAFHLISGSLKWTFTVGKAHFFTGMTAAPALIGVGYIVGFNIAVLVFLGGAISWLLAGPMMTVSASSGGDIVQMDHGALYASLKANMRFLGVGAMTVGGLWSIIAIRNGIAAGVRETLRGYRASAGRGVPPARTESDMDRRWLMFLVAATMLIVLRLYTDLTNDFAQSLLATLLMTVCSFFFVAVAAYIVGLVGSSNSPVSGMTICSVLLTSTVVFLAGYGGDKAILATLGVAGVVCCAACTSGDVCQDLKTGALVKATPHRQQWVEVLGVVTAAFVMQPVLRLLHNAYGIGSDAHLAPHLQGQALEAPQAGLFASLMTGVFGDEKLPWELIAWGALAGLGIILVDQLVLRPAASRFRMHVMPVAVGMYLPFGLTTAILLGGMLAWLAARTDRETGGYKNGVLVASGLIAGEAIAGVLIAVPKAAGIHIPAALDAGPLMTALTLMMVLAVSGWLLRVSRAG